MAQVTVDITEYDSLREGLKEAKKAIADLEAIQCKKSKFRRLFS